MEYLGDILCMSLDSIIFGICLRAYLRNKHALRSVEGAPEVQVDSNLSAFLDEKGGKFPYIAVRGNVKALSPAIESLNHPYISGVVQKLSIREHVVSRSSSGFWTESQRTINEVFNSIPFALTSKKGDVEVEVIDALAAEILDLEVISDRFDPSNLSFMDHMWGFFTGVRKRGLQTIEEVLKEGAFITAVGELQKEGNSLRIQPPTDGTPFFVSSMPLNSLVRRLDEKSNYYGFSFSSPDDDSSRQNCRNVDQFHRRGNLQSIINHIYGEDINNRIRKYEKLYISPDDDRSRQNCRKVDQWISFGFGVIGIILFGSIIRKYWKKHKERLKKEAERKRLESTRKERRKNVRNPEELPIEKICVVCQINPKEVILLPCGHVCLCEDCSEQITNFCPVCKSPIENRNPAYIA